MPPTVLVLVRGAVKIETSRRRNDEKKTGFELGLGGEGVPFNGNRRQMSIYVVVGIDSDQHSFVLEGDILEFMPTEWSSNAHLVLRQNQTIF